MQTALKVFRETYTGLTQVQVAEKAKITERGYQYYKAGEQVPNVYTAQRIAKALNTTVEDVFSLPVYNM